MRVRTMIGLAVMLAGALLLGGVIQLAVVPSSAFVWSNVYPDGPSAGGGDDTDGTEEATGDKDGAGGGSWNPLKLLPPEVTEDLSSLIRIGLIVIVGVLIASMIVGRRRWR